jgi:hypothetical protein
LIRGKCDRHDDLLGVGVHMNLELGGVEKLTLELRRCVHQVEL